MNPRRLLCFGVLPSTSALALASALAVACGTSDSQVGGDGGSGGGSGSSGSGGSSGSSSGGSSGGSGGSSGSSSGGSGGSSGSSGSSSGTGGSSGSSSGGTFDGGTCPAQTALTVGTKITVAVTWAASTAGAAGSGSADIWLLSKFTANGNQFTGKSQTCGIKLPDLSLTTLGQVAAGGTKVQITIPSSVWEAPSMPTYASTGMQTGWSPPSTFSIAPTLALIGLGLPSSVNAETFTWPTSSWSFPSGTTFPDSDGDSNAGITASPLNGNGYVYPPTAIGLGGSAPAADQVYITTRTEVSLAGAWTSCSDLSGTATVKLFDNHVVGCHISKGSTCTTGSANTQADFLDQNRTVYVPGSATFVAKALAASGTCADALTALP